MGGRKKPGAVQLRPARDKAKLQVRVTGAQHGGEARGFHLATLGGARFFKGPLGADDSQRSFAVDFFLQSPQRFFNWLAFFEFDFCQCNSLPLQSLRRRGQPRGFFGREFDERTGYFSFSKCQWANDLAFAGLSFHVGLMALPTTPVTLDAKQITDLNHQLSTMRHDINNQLSLILAALELLRKKPETTERMLATLSEQPPKILQSMQKFSVEFERLLGITRP